MSKKTIAKMTPMYQIFSRDSKRVKFKGKTFNTYEAARKFAVRWLRSKNPAPTFYPAIGIDGNMRVMKVA